MCTVHLVLLDCADVLVPGPTPDNGNNNSKKSNRGNRDNSGSIDNSNNKATEEATQSDVMICSLSF